MNFSLIIEGPLLGFISDRLNKRGQLILTSIFGLIIFQLTFYLLPNRHISPYVLGILPVLENTFYSLYLSNNYPAVRILTDEKQRSMAIGIINSI